MPRVRCAPCSWGPHSAATAVSDTLPSRISASCIPFPANRHGQWTAAPPGGWSVPPLIVELWPCRHSSLCLTEWQRRPAGAAGKLGRGSLAWGAEQGTGRAAAKHRGLLGLHWVERDRTRLFGGLVEETCPVLELEIGISWGPNVWRDTRDTPCLGSGDKARLPGCRHLC